jgi:hypothetical protein
MAACVPRLVRPLFGTDESYCKSRRTGKSLVSRHIATC